MEKKIAPATQPAPADTKPAEKFPLGKFFAWKGRDVSLSGLQVIVTSYLLLFCTDVLQLSPAFVGALLMISKFIQAVTQLFAGYIVDNTHTKLGKGRPWEFCIIGAWLCTILLFSCPPGWSTVVKSAWIVVMYFFIFSVFNSLLFAGETPYMLRAFPSRDQVIKVSSFGGIVTMLGAVIVSTSFPVAMGYLGTSDGGWRTLILIYGIPLMLIGVLRLIFVPEHQIELPGHEQDRVSVKDIWRMVKTNKYVWVYAGIMGLFNVIQGMNIAAQYFKYVVGDIRLQGIMGVLSIVMLPVMFVFPKLMKKLTVANLIQVAAVVSAVGYIILFFAGKNIPVLIFGNILISLLVLPLSYMGNVIIMSLATYNESLGLPRMEGSTNVAVGLVNSIFNGLGTGLMGVLLSVAGYVGAKAIQPASSLLMIRSIYALIPLAATLLIIVFAGIFSKLERKIPAIEAKLKQQAKQ
ncbi:MFS transporter [Lacticaseibacillus rhamnosus]|uniref:MFS transporter n=1 Tax=Lacticaseibacillus rhamnosus TaxID=47715 RepID=UPI003DA81447